MDASEFIEKHQQPGFAGSAAAGALLLDPFFRDRLLRALGKPLNASHRPLLLTILKLEADWRRQQPESDDGDLFENIYYCALLLFRIGDVRDSLAIWKAKMTDMDTGCGMDSQFMEGGGKAETIAYLRSLTGDADAAKAAEYLAQEDQTYPDLAAWLEYRTTYFSSMMEP